MELTAKNVNSILTDVFFKEEEIENGKPKEGLEMVIVKAMQLHSGFHKVRLESHREDVKSMLNQLSDDFFVSGGGGATALNAVVTDKDVQWAEHRNLDELIALGLGLDLVKFLMPRELWKVLPGGMPMIQITFDKEEVQEVHQNHIDNPNQYDKDGKFIVGSGEKCPSCGTEWEDHFAVAVCPCLDDM